MRNTKNCFLSARKDLHRVLLASLILLIIPDVSWASDAAQKAEFPRSFASYNDAQMENVGQILAHRIAEAPFNLVATIIFFCAIIHTFMASKFMAMSDRRYRKHRELIASGQRSENSRDVRAGILYFLGEVEVVFGLWLIPLTVSIVAFYGWDTAVHYINHGVNLNEAGFVVVIMILASTRPILKLAENLMLMIAGFFGGTLAVFWFTVMTIGPMLGSLITEPAAMTICALLLSKRLYDLNPSDGLKYATLGLLFVNVSVGGTLTNFAAPPVLMVAKPWGWDMGFMLSNFGWKALLGIVAANTVYCLVFRSEMERLQKSFAIRKLKDEISRRHLPRSLIDKKWREASVLLEKREHASKVIETSVRLYVREVQDAVEQKLLPRLVQSGIDPELAKDALNSRFREVELYQARKEMPSLLSGELRANFQDPDWDNREDPVPVSITLFHIGFMVWTIVNAHHAAFFILGLLFFLGFAKVTEEHQNEIRIAPAMMVGFFLAGLVIHGGVQAWWIAPILGSLDAFQLMLGATALTAFNDNAAITFLATLVPNFTDELKYAVLAGAVTGGGLTVIANAPNPAGQSILKQHFGKMVSPLWLFKAAIFPTLICWMCFAFL